MDIRIITAIDLQFEYLQTYKFLWRFFVFVYPLSLQLALGF